MKSYFKKALKNIKKHNLIEEGDEVLCALSGGPDSVYLFYALLEAKKEIPFYLKVASLNHGVRKEAYEEIEFCKNLAKKNGLEFFEKSCNMEEFAEKKKISIEDAGRRLRYDFFYSIIGKNGKIALGHHLNDQAETILMNLLRGTGLRGLAGMDYSNNRRIRPLLNISKEEILDTLDSLNISYYTDHTNFQNDYKRNEIRNTLIPEIEEVYNPKFQDSLVRLGEIAREDDEALDFLTELEFKKIIRNQVILREEFLKNSFSIQKRILFKIFEKYRDLKDITFQQIEELLSLFEKDISKEMILKDIRFISTYDGVKFILTEEEKVEEIPFNIGELHFGHWEISSQLISFEKFTKIEKKGRFFYDGKILEKDLKIRARKKGESFQPFGFSGTKSLRNFFIDEKIPQYKRNSIPLLSDSERIYLVGNYRRGQGFSVTENSEKILMIEMREQLESL